MILHVLYKLSVDNLCASCYVLDEIFVPSTSTWYDMGTEQNVTVASSVAATTTTTGAGGCDSPVSHRNGSAREPSLKRKKVM